MPLGPTVLLCEKDREWDENGNGKGDFKADLLIGNALLCLEIFIHYKDMIFFLINTMYKLQFSRKTTIEAVYSKVCQEH